MPPAATADYAQAHLFYAFAVDLWRAFRPQQAQPCACTFVAPEVSGECAALERVLERTLERGARSCGPEASSWSVQLTFYIGFPLLAFLAGYVAGVLGCPRRCLRRQAAEPVVDAPPASVGAERALAVDPRRRIGARGLVVQA